MVDDLEVVDDAVEVPHWGITLRTLFGAALESWPEGQPGECRQFKVVLKSQEIATINVKKHPL